MRNGLKTAWSAFWRFGDGLVTGWQGRLGRLVSASIADCSVYNQAMRLTTAPRLGVILEQFRDWPEGWVYCIRDESGAIVYIGSTGDLDERITAHRSAPYESSHQVSLREWLLVNQHNFEALSTHPTMREAWDAERTAIQPHQPRFNVRHNQWNQLRK